MREGDSPMRLEVFRCERLPGNPRVTRGGCGHRHKRARDPRGLQPDERHSFDTCRECPIGQAHLRGETPDVTPGAFAKVTLAFKASPPRVRYESPRPGPHVIGFDCSSVAGKEQPPPHTKEEPPMAKYGEKECPCGTTFTPKKSGAEKYCSDDCTARPAPAEKPKRGKAKAAARRAPATTPTKATLTAPAPAPATTGLTPAQVLAAAGFEPKCYRVPKGLMILVED